jgi:salicylate hydroxylase
LYGDPGTVLDVYGYDAEGHAEAALEKHLNGGREPLDPGTRIAKSMRDKYMGWFRPSQCGKQPVSKL